ncbi:MAG: VOC family protein [Nakamurella sp.]
MSDSIRLSSVTLNCPDAATLAEFYAAITGGKITFSHPTFATLHSQGGRIDFQTVERYLAPSWPDESSLIHLDFLVDDLVATEARVLANGATRFEVQPNSDHCLVFADPASHPFCLTTLDELG